VRRVVARRRVGGHAHERLQEAHLLVEVGVDPGVQGVVGWRVIMRLGRGSVARVLEQVLKARTYRSVSSLVMDSSGLWLMPAFAPRMKSMACGITSCSFMASWPAPLGMRKHGQARARARRAPSAPARRGGSGAARTAHGAARA
jgi:hypothetical protein